MHRSCLTPDSFDHLQFSFDGERCHYVSLYKAIRDLLALYAQRPPPLTPLAEAVRRLCPLESDAVQAPGTEAELLQVS